MANYSPLGFDATNAQPDVLNATDTITVAGGIIDTAIGAGVGNASTGAFTTISSSGEATFASAIVSDLTDNRVVIAGTSGALEDSNNLTFDGSTLAITGALTASTTANIETSVTVGAGDDMVIGAGSIASGSATLSITSGGAISFGDDNLTTTGTLASGEATLSSAKVTDLSANRVVFSSSADGDLSDSADLGWDGSSLDITGNVDASGSVAAGNMTISSGSIIDTSGAISFGDENLSTTGTLSTGSASITGDLSVSGSIVSSGSMDVVVSDRFIDLNNGYLNNATTQASGLTMMMRAASGGGSGQTLNGAAFAVKNGATDAKLSLAGFTPATDFAVGDIVQISGLTDALAGNNGLFVVSAAGANAGDDLSICGGSNNAVPVNAAPFAQDDFIAGTATGMTAATIVRVDLGVTTMADGALTNAQGNAIATKGAFITAYAESAAVQVGGTAIAANRNAVTYSQVEADVDLQDAYDLGSTITTDANGGVLTIAGNQNMVISTSGTLDVNTEASFDAGPFSVGAAGGNDAVTLNSGNQGLNIQSVGTGAVAIGRSDGTTASVTLGGTTTAINGGTINVGALGAAGKSINIGEGTQANPIVLDSGSSTVSINGAGNIGIGTDADAGALGLGSAGARAITLGNASATSLLVDSVEMSIDSRDTTNFTMTTAVAQAKTLTIQAVNTDAGGSGNIVMQASTDITVYAEEGIVKLEQGKMVAAAGGVAAGTVLTVTSATEVDEAASTTLTSFIPYGIAVGAANAGDEVKAVCFPGSIVSMDVDAGGSNAAIGDVLYLTAAGKVTPDIPGAGNTIMRIGIAMAAGTGSTLAMYSPQFIAVRNA